MLQRIQALLARLMVAAMAHVFAAPVGATIPGSNEHAPHRAVEPLRGSPEQPPQIELIVVTPAAGAPSLENAAPSLGRRLASWFRPIGVATTCRTSLAVDPEALLEPSGQQGIRVWLLLGDAASRGETSTAHLYFIVERSPKQEPKFLWRSVELRSGLDEFGAELLIQVVHLSSLALWEGSIETPREQVAEILRRESGTVVPQASPKPDGHAIVSPPMANALSVAPRPSFRAASSVRISYRSVTRENAHRAGAWLASLGIGYAARWRGPERVAIGPEVMLGANRWSETYGLGIRASWQSLSTEVVALERGTFETTGNSLRLGTRMNHDLPRELAFTTELGAGLDIIRYRATQWLDVQAEPPTEPHDLRPFVYLELGLQRRVGPLGLGVAGLLAWQIRRTRYGVLTDGRFDATLTPWRLQPGLRLELSWQ